MDIVRGVLSALKNNGIAQAYGFANGRDIAIEPGLTEILKYWLKAGYPLGNHSYNHTDLNKVTVQVYISDIEKMDRLLQTLSNVSDLIGRRRVYRYPFLDEGNTLEKRDAVRAYLFKKDYKIAEVTIDYSDWAWNGAYSRCTSQQDQKSLAWLKAHFVDGAERSLRSSKAIAQLLFGRDIAQILLVHDSAYNAIMLDTVLRELHRQGVKFITVDEALADPVYKMNPNFAYKIGLTFLEQVAASRGVDITELADTPYTIDGLNEICSEQPAPK